MSLRFVLSFRFAVIAASMVAIPVTAAQAQTGSTYPELELGKYLTRAGDCIDCHTVPGSKPYAGGRPIETPFGTIYSPNITPDRETGIGAWSLEDFTRALKQGVETHGNHLYPAFPYPYYTKVTSHDIEAIYHYLQSLDPVRQVNRTSNLTWPLNNRVFMRGWNLLYFSQADYQTNSKKTPEWNRGAYLVEGLGHCAACHTPKNTFGADKTSAYMQGSNIGNWVAPNLSEDAMKGLRDWSADDIVEYLKTGRNSYAQAGGPMGEVVQYSTSFMTQDDLHAIAVYLKDLPGTADKPEPESVSGDIMKAGAAIYQAQCSACHQPDGSGVAKMFPALAGGGVSVQTDAASSIRVILQGARTVATSARPTASSMPAFGWKLKDDEIAAVTTYIRNSWGNSAPAASVGQVNAIRGALHAAAE